METVKRISGPLAVAKMYGSRSAERVSLTVTGSELPDCGGCPLNEWKDTFVDRLAGVLLRIFGDPYTSSSHYRMDEDGIVWRVTGSGGNRGLKLSNGSFVWCDGVDRRYEKPGIECTGYLSVDEWARILGHAKCNITKLISSGVSEKEIPN